MGTVGILNYLPLPVWVLLGSLITCRCQYGYCWAPQLLAAGSMGTAGLLNYLQLPVRVLLGSSITCHWQYGYCWAPQLLAVGLAVWVLGSGRLLKLYLDLSLA